MGSLHRGLIQDAYRSATRGRGQLERRSGGAMASGNHGSGYSLDRHACVCVWGCAWLASVGQTLL